MNTTLEMQACRRWGCRAPPDFGRSTKGADYAHQIILAPRIFRPSDGPEGGNIGSFITKIGKGSNFKTLPQEIRPLHAYALNHSLVIFHRQFCKP